ncbi:MAG: HEAT repeat domain-containing protein, partial [Acidobacteriota bacterium]
MTRWKLTSALLAALAAMTALHGRGATATATAPVTGRAALWRPIRVPASALGVSAQELVDQLLAAHTADEMAPLADKLGAVGGDDAIDSIRPLLDDPRRGVPAVVAGVIGHIASDHAVDVLLGHAVDERPEVRDAALRALGETHAARAESRLEQLAGAAGDPAQPVA